GRRREGVAAVRDGGANRDRADQHREGGRLVSGNTRRPNAQRERGVLDTLVGRRRHARRRRINRHQRRRAGAIGLAVNVRRGGGDRQRAVVVILRRHRQRRSTLFPYTTLFRSGRRREGVAAVRDGGANRDRAD